MVFIKEKDLIEDIESKKAHIIDFFEVGKKYVAEQYQSHIKNKIKLYTELDKSHFLTIHRGLDNFATLMTLLEKSNVDINKVDLFEAGAYSKFPKNDRCYVPDIPFFMASDQVNYNYFGFEHENSFTKEDIEKVFSEESKYNLTEKLNKKTFRKNLEKNLTNDYNVFKKKVIESKNPIVFSNLVLGCPGFRFAYDFWNLPGLHIHQFIEGDVAPIKENESIEKRNNNLIFNLRAFNLLAYDIKVIRDLDDVIILYKNDFSSGFWKS